MRDVLAEHDPEALNARLADAIVEFGPELMSTLHAAATDAAFASALGLYDPRLPTLAGEAQRMFAAWIVGERISPRADEPERRVRAGRILASIGDEQDEVAARMTAVTILRLPAAHPERDLELARDILRRQYERCRRAGAGEEELVAAFYLLTYELESPERSRQLIEQSMEAVAPAVHPAAVRDFLEGLRSMHVFVQVMASADRTDLTGRPTHPTGAGVVNSFAARVAQGHRPTPPDRSAPFHGRQ